ncbi:matrilin-1-like isoform X2 [Mytilus galloprovincialis]|uniref:cartilage matrix protein-like n=1 Tax=Mytilus edulis TaxID=6550 RepID=UPI0039EF828B
MISYRIFLWIVIFPSNVYLLKDVVFVVDKSASLSAEDFSGAIDFIYNVTKFITVGSTATQFSVVTFSSDITERFDLNDYSTNATILNAISGLKSITPSGSTYTYDALTFVRTSSFLSSKGSRSNADKTVIILTDGQSVNYPRTAAEADLLKTNLGAEVFSIGIGSAISASNVELLSMSSDPDSYYSHHVESYVDLCSLIPTVVPKIDPTVTPAAVPGCPTAAASTSPDDNTVVVAGVAAAAAVAGIGLTALIASLLEKKVRGLFGKNSKVDPYDSMTRQGTNRAIFDANALNDPSAREVPAPDV